MLTPLEIENKKFSKQLMNGYSVEEVDDFLDILTLDYAKLYKEVSELRLRINEMEDSVSHYKTIEGTLQNTLVMAQSTSEEIKKIATQQAEQIIKDAELEAKQSVMAIKTQKIEETKKLEALKKSFEIYKVKMEALLISQLELLKDTTDDYCENSYSMSHKNYEEDYPKMDLSNDSFANDEEETEDNINKFGIENI